MAKFNGYELKKHRSFQVYHRYIYIYLHMIHVYSMWMVAANIKDNIRSFMTNVWSRRSPTSDVFIVNQRKNNKLKVNHLSKWLIDTLHH